MLIFYSLTSLDTKSLRPSQAHPPRYIQPAITLDDLILSKVPRNDSSWTLELTQSYISKGIWRQGIGSFVRDSYVSTLWPVVICPYLCTSDLLSLVWIDWVQMNLHLTAWAPITGGVFDWKGSYISQNLVLIGFSLKRSLPWLFMRIDCPLPSVYVLCFHLYTWPCSYSLFVFDGMAPICCIRRSTCYSCSISACIHILLVFAWLWPHARMPARLRCTQAGRAHDMHSLRGHCMYTYYIT